MAKKFTKLSIGDSGSVCDGLHVIEVSELPIENIDSTVLYKCGDCYYKYSESAFGDVFICYAPSMGISFMEIAAGQGFTYSFNSIPTKTTENIHVTNATAGVWHWYFIADENDLFMYGDFVGTGANDWYSYGSLDGGTFNGVIDDISEATQVGYYAIGGSSWTKFQTGGGIINVTELPTENIDSQALYFCNNKYCRYIDGEWKEYTIPNLDTRYYTISEDGTYEITPYEGSDGYSEVTVKMSFDNKILRRMISGSIEELTQSDLTSTRGSSGTSIGTIRNYAFYKHPSLTKMYIPRSHIGEYAFAECTKLTEVTGYMRDVGQYAFYGCSNLTNIENRVFGGNGRLIDIWDYAFAGTKIGGGITLSGGRIRNNAFEGTLVTNLVVNGNMGGVSDSYRIYSEAFKNCAELTTIKVDLEANNTWCHIASNAFEGCTKLKDAYLLHGISSGGNALFLPDTVENIYVPAQDSSDFREDWASMADKLKEVYYFQPKGYNNGSIPRAAALLDSTFNDFVNDEWLNSAGWSINSDGYVVKGDPAYNAFIYSPDGKKVLGTDKIMFSTPSVNNLDYYSTGVYVWPSGNAVTFSDTLTTKNIIVEDLTQELLFTANGTTFNKISVTTDGSMYFYSSSCGSICVASAGVWQSDYTAYKAIILDSSDYQILSTRFGKFLKSSSNANMNLGW